MWSKREQTAGRGCRLSPSAPVDDPPMYIFIYFIAFPNKRSYNYSTPRAASTAHFNVNPTKKVKRMKARWRLYLHAGSPLLCSTSQVRFASVCLTEAPRAWRTCVQRGSVKWSPAPLNQWVVFDVFHGAEYVVYLIWRAGSSHLQLL